MASPAYDAKYRKYDDAPGRVVPCPLLSPDPSNATLAADRCEGSLVVGDEQYEPWGTPHGGVIAELAERCMAGQSILAAGLDFDARPVTSSCQFRRRWRRGGQLHWSPTVIATADIERAGGKLCFVQARLSMADDVVTETTGTFLALPRMDGWDGTEEERVRAYLIDLPAPASLQLPVHRPGWSAGRIEGYFESPPASLHVALDEAMAAAANTVRGDAHGDEIPEDFLLADMDLTLIGGGSAMDDGIEYESTIRRGGNGRDGFATARLVLKGRVLAYSRGRAVFLHGGPSGRPPVD
ncbi:MAG: hypothetical protein E4H03_05175 [Myxococcales bacterium]|nr:MAG: hypothetical protein E4H03_05175 [Myxococcales bacterium]